MVNIIDIASSPIAEGGILAGILAFISTGVYKTIKFIGKHKSTAFASLKLTEEALDVAVKLEGFYADGKLDKDELKKLGTELKQVSEAYKALKDTLKK